MARVFLSYRRSDTGAYADRLTERLHAFQFESVFQDREDIALGQNFADAIRQDLSRCDAMLVLIGPRWLTPPVSGGGRRIDDPADWVRREVALALGRGIPVVPVLFDGARAPTAADLPPELALLATAQGYDLNGNYFDRDADDLARRLEQLLVSAGSGTDARPPVARELLGQLRMIWVGLSLVTILLAVLPLFAKALPAGFWVFPGTMTLAAFLWWLYWLGESIRPIRGRTT